MSNGPKIGACGLNSSFVGVFWVGLNLKFNISCASVNFVTIKAKRLPMQDLKIIKCLNVEKNV
jgi:hypothetical protein